MRNGIGELRCFAQDLGEELRQVLLRLLRERFAPLRQMCGLDGRSQSQEQLLVMAAVGVAGVAWQRGEVLRDRCQLECHRARITHLGQQKIGYRAPLELRQISAPIGKELSVISRIASSKAG